MSDEPVKVDVREVLADVFATWLRSDDRIVCANCGGAGGFDEHGNRRTPEATHFRRLQADASDPFPEFCYECGEEAKARDARKAQARRTIAQVIPPLFEDKTLGNFDTPPGDPAVLARVSAWRFQPRRGRSLYLWGTSGVGKSHLAYSLAIREIHEGRRVVALEWSDFLGKLRATFGSKYQGRSEADIQTELDRADLVVIDDLGSSKPTEWAAERLWLIVNGRHIAERQVVITSNFPLDDTGGKIDLRRWLGQGGGRTTSRLSTMCDVVHVRGADVRQQLEIKPGSAA